eukprot:jgi/Hompol1/525/HPOL_004175-RA
MSDSEEDHSDNDEVEMESTGRSSRNSQRLSFDHEATHYFRMPSGSARTKVFCQRESLLRILFVELPGPLVSASVIVPTISDNHHGLPHTLEHLVFCGSQSVPHRGFLDYLATRCLSTGTNAYTTDDHTSYEITTAGSQGMIEILPVFLDHILNPTLRDRQFMTEVHHLNHEAKHQGVVYCEMAGREHTEADLLDRHLRSLLFQNQTTYSFECGGLTKDIANLTNKEIIEYHQRFYRPENITIIICGSINQNALFRNLSNHPHLFEPKPPLPEGYELPVIRTPVMPGNPGDLISERVKFPSADEEVGSIGFAWRGPPSEDIRTMVAIDVLFRFLHENAASLLAQEFTERADPYASHIDFELKGYVDSAIFLVFSGVPYFLGKQAAEDGNDDGDDDDNHDDDDDDDDDPMDEDGDGDGDDDDDDEDNDDDDDDEEEEQRTARRDLFDDGVFFGLLRSVLQRFVDSGFTEPGGMVPAIKRHRRKILEGLEDEPHESLTGYLIPDITRHFLAASSTLNDTRAQGRKPSFATRSQIFDIIDSLEKEKEDFWIALCKRWLLDVPTCQVLMEPSSSLAVENQEREQREIKERRDALGPDGLALLKVESDLALKENEVNITEELRAKFPAVPDASRAPVLRAYMENIHLVEDFDKCEPFAACQIVHTETAFINIRLGIHTGSLHHDLRPYLVLFQELLFQTPLLLPAAAGINMLKMDYREAVRYASDVFASHEAAVGFGNDLWTSSWLSEMFMMAAVAERSDWERMARFMAQVLLFAEFSEERIVTIAKNLLSNLTEIKRDGNAMLAAVSTRMYCHRPASRATKQDKSKFDTHSNDDAISIFTQESFLRGVVRQCKDGKASEVIKKLDELRSALLDSQQAHALGFVRIGIPLEFSLAGSGEESDNREIVGDWLRIWSSEFEKFKQKQSPKGKKRATVPTGPFPFPRTPFSIAHLNAEFGQSLLVPIEGLATSYLGQFVACDVLRPHPHPDYFATSLLAEVLSRSEGPLYMAVRGPGFAYGVSLSVCLWIGQLSFDLYEASDPHKALIAFYRILESLCTKEGFADMCSPFNIETARASVAYRWVSEGATAGGVISTALRASLQGFTSLEERRKYVERLYQVTSDDLQRVLRSHFLKFFDATQRTTVLVTVPGDVTKHLIHAFEQGASASDLDGLDDDEAAKFDKYRVALKQVSLQDLR